MNITAVTMGMDEANYSHAQNAAIRVNKFMGFEPVIINTYHTDKKFGDKFAEICYNKLFFFDMLPDADVIFYFDNDWCLNKPFNLELVKDDKFNAVRDRVNAQFLKDHCNRIGVDVSGYFNAGFWIVSRKFKWVFDKAKEIYQPHSFLDQDAINKVLTGSDIVNFLPPDWNNLDYNHSEGGYNNFTAIHNKSAYLIHTNG